MLTHLQKFTHYHLSLPTHNMSTQAGNSHTNNHSHSLTCAVQSTKFCWAASLKGILRHLLHHSLTGSRSCLCCHLTGGCYLGCVVVGDCWGLQTCGEDAERVKFPCRISLEGFVSLARCWCWNFPVAVKGASTLKTSWPWEIWCQRSQIMTRKLASQLESLFLYYTLSLSLSL